MKFKQISPHVYKAETWMGVKMSAWVIQEGDYSIIIDTGLSFMGSHLLSFAEEKAPLQMILLTHGHSDHVGGLSSILRKRKVPVYAHPNEIKYIEGKEPYPKRKKPERGITPGIVKPLPEDENHNLHTMMNLVPYPTPGHSPGHTAYFHKEDNVLISGDMFTSKRGKLTPPMKAFTADAQEAVESSRLIEELNPDLISICHGNDIEHPQNQLQDYLEKYKK
ncbi:glyoxylase-like metal-dependent hydrolase (beta-lactamase superfamily II) [Sinobaca qinghaiensis]|uniref:Glyoxylase-like metal-dependent hydrolase (Beta-lactamase superfamily II) n=1 Tax=Sinobaca qinghaiensis TaxID=342944 RepID=A0A419UZJ8_9BACL|nr:MBL fold metallo-hydrolase [Sinobaca qinghaiensis]RKD71120.1 glyoxylase-like metal-dependent hydrolase (beta-lactamase superfamily II) [Sinobaca qinghaiensis]